MPLCVASPSQLLSACPSTEILTPISISSPVSLSFLFSQKPPPSLFLTAHQGVPYALVPVAQTSQLPKHPYVAVAQTPPYATGPQKLPYVVAPQAQQRNVVALIYRCALATPSELPVSQLSPSDQHFQPQP